MTKRVRVAGEPGADHSLVGLDRPRVSLFDAVAQYLAEDDWSMTAEPEEGYFWGHVSDECGSWRLTVAVADEENVRRVYITSFLPAVVPAGRRDAVALELNRLNSDVALGAFCLDMDTGMVNYRNGIDLGDADLTPGLFRESLGFNLGVTANYYQGIMGVAFGGAAEARVTGAGELQ